jgi:regulator of nonsense transcripts 1
MESTQKFYDYEDINEFSDSDTSITEPNPTPQPYPAKDSLPAHACDYCSLSLKDAVARCTLCNRWFCNGQGELTSGSHLIHHLVKAKHKDISLHPESQHGETLLECYLCGNKNVFLLGFVPLTSTEDK